MINVSPNFDDRDPKVELQFVIIHYTGMRTSDDAMHRLCDPLSKVSAHYFIEEDGRLFNLVEETKRAWHAGRSSWRGITDMNSASLGVELVNPGHQHGYRPFTPPQLATLTGLLRGMIKRYNLDPRVSVLAHADIAPERKEDPGELFPWRQLASEGIGLFPEPLPQDYGFADDEEVQNLLYALGYNVPDTGSYDQPTRAALIAFQRHYHPENLTGTPERETVARLRALYRMLT